jgi:hypothetical protein
VPPVSRPSPRRRAPCLLLRSRAHGAAPHRGAARRSAARRLRHRGRGSRTSAGGRGAAGGAGEHLPQRSPARGRPLRRARHHGAVPRQRKRVGPAAPASAPRQATRGVCRRAVAPQAVRGELHSFGNRALVLLPRLSAAARRLRTHCVRRGLSGCPPPLPSPLVLSGHAASLTPY